MAALALKDNLFGIFHFTSNAEMNLSTAKENEKLEQVYLLKLLSVFFLEENIFLLRFDSRLCCIPVEGSWKEVMEE